MLKLDAFQHTRGWRGGVTARHAMQTSLSSREIKSTGRVSSLGSMEYIHLDDISVYKRWAVRRITVCQRMCPVGRAPKVARRLPNPASASNERISDDTTIRDLDASSIDLNQESHYIEIGIVGPPHGVKGEFKVQSLTDWPEERLGQKGTRYLKPPDSTYHMARLKSAPSIEKVTLMRGRASVYKGREVWIVKLKGINTPEEAQTIHGHTLMVHESVREDLDDEDEFYVQQLLGLRVELMNNDIVGTVVDIMDGTGTHDVLCIEHVDAASTILLPFAREIVPVVDITGGVLQISPPEGLLEMYLKKPETEKKKKTKRRQQKEQL